jgi:hypothetical protein
MAEYPSKQVCAEIAGSNLEEGVRARVGEFEREEPNSKLPWPPLDSDSV